MINSSVVFITFKRPKETKKIYKIISKVKPKKKYTYFRMVIKFIFQR